LRHLKGGGGSGCSRSALLGVLAMARNGDSKDLVAFDIACGNWTDDDRRELRLILMADELATIAYRTVDWRHVAVLGRAIVALAEEANLRSIR